MGGQVVVVGWLVGWLGGGMCVLSTCVCGGGMMKGSPIPWVIMTAATAILLQLLLLLSYYCYYYAAATATATATVTATATATATTAATATAMLRTATATATAMDCYRRFYGLTATDCYCYSITTPLLPSLNYYSTSVQATGTTSQLLLH